MSEAAAPRQGILSLSIKDKNALYQAYMPFVTNGGLFIPTDRDYMMGQEVFMLLNLMEEPERLPIAGKVVWKTPLGSSGYRTAGIGVQFSDQDGGIARAKIENYLAGALGTDKSTHTL
jgi:type IV pilus assembly protein PilZ